MTAPDPTAAFRDQLWDAIVTARSACGRVGPDALANDIVDALEPVIRQVVAAELRRLADECGRSIIGTVVLLARAHELDPVPVSADALPVQGDTAGGAES